MTTFYSKPCYIKVCYKGTALYRYMYPGHFFLAIIGNYCFLGIITGLQICYLKLLVPWSLSTEITLYSLKIMVKIDKMTNSTGQVEIKIVQMT